MLQRFSKRLFFCLPLNIGNNNSDSNANVMVEFDGIYRQSPIFLLLTKTPVGYFSAIIQVI